MVCSLDRVGIAAGVFPQVSSLGVVTDDSVQRAQCQWRDVGGNVERSAFQQKVRCVQRDELFPARQLGGHHSRRGDRDPDPGRLVAHYQMRPTI